ncbi:TadE family protein [Cystobacter ferrugineus]|uniref:Pilus assembly protein TadE n=1 Tax=Cystobacter ferrugineus TaxID=83449 RepID=A0A1L9AYY4_9BACT|nr:TadE family protein [Cystobacter ferrugineus]OJH35214.1 pilus assembly protein TadE [Cystobacter ferrugineus]
MTPRVPPNRGQSGQASVEAALSMPLTVFLMLGTLQLFLMLQGRIMAEYAAFRAVRSGSVKHGDCTAMTHAAVLALMPSYHSFMRGSGSPAQKLGQAFGRYKDNVYRTSARGNPVEGALVWILRDSPVADTVPDEDQDFDQADGANRRMEIRLVYWYPLKIPFADWVISRMTLARWGLQDYTAQDPLTPVRRANWSAENPTTLEGSIRAELLRRVSIGFYSMPIHASASLRMMTPVRRQHFQTQNCAPAPEVL